MKNYIFLFLLVVFNVQLLAQPVLKPVDKLLTKKKLGKTKHEPEGYILVDEKLRITADQFINGNKRELCEHPKSDLLKIGSQRSMEGREHHRYQQMWDGVPIEGQFVLAHEQKGSLNAVNGALVTGLSIITTPALTEQVALNMVLQPNTVKYAWDILELETDLQAAKNDPTATSYPKGKLVIVTGDHAPISSKKDYQLAWRFDIYSVEPHNHEAVYVNAHTGQLIKKRSMMRHSFVNGKGNTNYSGNQKNITCNMHGSHYELKNEIVETRKFNGWFYGYGSPINNFTPNWTSKKDAIDVHWGVEEFVDYLDVILDRDGYNGNNGRLTAMISLNQNNAFWDGTRIWFGKGDDIGRSSFTSLDIVAHEYTHAMLDQIILGGLTYAGESGAIEESYCDIFGELLELYIKGNADWKVGGEITLTDGNPDGIGLRTLSTTRQYKDNLWHDGPSDNWGVHSNSAIHNYWFYLLAFGNGSTVNGIGIPAATELLYETLFWLQPNTDYIDLQNTSKATAQNLSSFSQAMKDDIRAAWLEVGLNIQIEEIANVQPSNGAVLFGGLVDTIRWDTNLDIDSVNLEYSMNGGASWNSITRIPYSTGFYPWDVPQAFTKTALVRVVDATNIGTRGVSENYFQLINSGNLAPVASDDDVYTKQGFSEIIEPLNNDEDEVELDTNSIAIVTNISPNEGTLQVQGSSIRIDVEQDFIGTFSFNYQVCDYGMPLLCDTAVVTVNVEEIPPPEWAMDNWDVQSLGETTVGNLMADDYLIDSTWSFVGWDTVKLNHGSLTIDNATGDFSYTADSLGRDTIRYFISTQDGSETDEAFLYLFNIDGGGFEKDSMYLVTLLYSLKVRSGSEFNWDTNSPISSWYGVTLNNNRVEKIILYQGSYEVIRIPNLNLPHLTHLSIEIDNGYYFGGRNPIPDFRLPNLTFLNLSPFRTGFGIGKLTGNIPNFQMPQLTYLRLQDNEFLGKIPEFDFLQLDTLILSDNQLTGTIPDFDLPNLSYINLESNQLTGTIPDFDLPNLSCLNLKSNQLTGTISDFDLPNLSYLNLESNQLTGTIPDFDLPNLSYLNLKSNQLTGTIPDFDLPNLSYLNLESNQLTGTIPDFDLPNLSYLNLKSSQLTGTIPDFDLPNLSYLNLESNQLTGTIPDFDLPNLEILFLRDNQLFGSIPNFNFPVLSYLDLKNNKLTFSGIEENLGKYIYRPASTSDSFERFIFAPQANIPIYQIQDTLMVFAGDTISDNTYYWFFENETTPISIITGQNYFLPSKDGNYHCKVRNKDIDNHITIGNFIGFSNFLQIGQDLVLNSDSLFVTPKCYTTSNFPDSISICPSDTLDSGYSMMLSYKWIYNDSVVGTSQKLSAALDGTYVLQMQDFCNNPIVSDTIEVVIDCIYPGDTNQDGIVNHLDLLEIGLYFGANGIPREDTSTAFNPIAGNDWLSSTNGGVNLKHLDTNGDGSINVLDTLAIRRNYGKIWQELIHTNDSLLSPIILIPDIYSAYSGIGDTLMLKYSLENAPDSLVVYYGLAYTTIIKAPIPFEGLFDLSASEAANPEQYLIISEQVDTNKIETAITKTDLQDEVGAGASIAIGGSQITTERDLPGGDSLIVIDISVENVRLTTVNSSLSTGSFFPSISSGTTSLYYTENLAFTLNPTPSSCEEYGKISTRILHGVAPFSFLWSDGQTTEIATGLSVGTYNLSVSDNAGKLIVGEATVKGITKIDVNFTISNPTNGNKDGKISLNPHGGTGDFNIHWSDINAQTGPTATGLSPGSYIAIVQDKACVESFSFEVGDVETASNEISAIRIRPNPAIDWALIRFDLLSPKYLNIRVADMLGTLMYTQHIEAQAGINEIILDITKYPEGIYVLSIEDTNGKRKTSKFITIR